MFKAVFMNHEYILLYLYIILEISEIILVPHSYSAADYTENWR